MAEVLTARCPKPPPRPLDPETVAAIVAPVRDLILTALTHFAAADYDAWTHAGCRLIASTLTAIRRAELCRDLAGIREQVAFLVDYSEAIPERLRDLRTPGAWARRGPITLIDFGDSGWTRKR